MGPEQRERLMDGFARAVASPPEEREALLGELAGDDSEVLRELRSLLAFSDDDGFLESPAHLDSAPPPGRSPAGGEMPVPTTLGPYRILCLLGRGGMGEVYLAEQAEPMRRQVAVKVIRRGVDTEQVLRRFDAERQALARMSHPNIASVYDAGATEDGRPYFVMEYVDGVSAIELCDQLRLDTAERLELFLQICDGVQHAHQKGVIHRDIKSSNILVVIEGDRPVPKIIDFGIAKATDSNSAPEPAVTTFGQVVGTLEYMSPEQAGSGGLDIDTRTDVYSLGVLLYLLLVGCYPLESEALRSAPLDERFRRIREEDPALPSRRLRGLGQEAREIAWRRRVDSEVLIRALRGDLDRITMKALEKDRGQRYASPAELGADLRRYLHDEPVLARPPSRFYSWRKFVRRNRLAVGSFALVALGVLAGVAGIVAGLLRALDAEARAREEAEAKRAVLHFVHSVFQEQDPDGESPSSTTDDILSAGTQQIGLLDDQPLVQAELMALIGEIQMRVDNHEAARPLLETALEIKRELYGERHPDVFDVRNALGVLAAVSRDDEAARRHFEAALTLAEEIFGPDHLETSKVLKNLADTLARQGELGRARRLHERGLAIRQWVEPDSALVARSLRSIADLHRKGGDYARAIPLLEESLRIRLRTEPAGHYRIGYGYFFLGQALREAGRAGEARPQLERALDIWQAVFAEEEDHHLLRDASFELALTLAELGDHVRAEPLFLRALGIDERQLGHDHPYVAETLDGYAVSLRAAGRAREASAIEARASAIRSGPAWSP
ncbi:MAG: serine/threonine-protein kinase [Holophagales bacterium]|nr:serine/threonine-protein kinase [Holophagales bacterium]